jgi:hypothetical protein
MTRIDAEPLPMELFDELADRRLPALLGARSQARQLLRIHAEAPRHFKLTSIEPTDLLCVPPRLFIVGSMRLRHAAITSCCLDRTRTSPTADGHL